MSGSGLRTWQPHTFQSTLHERFQRQRPAQEPTSQSERWRCNSRPKACRRIPRRADARLRIRLLVGPAGEVPSHIRPKSYLCRQRSYPACCAIQSQNILTTTMASSTATAAKVVPESLVTPFRATLEHSAKLLAGSLILIRNPNLPHVISAFRWDIYARRLDCSAATLSMPLR
ncbi:hypothetical protein D9M68_558410 [compost metagenome]